MFSERLKQIFDLLRATDIEIAEFAGFDRTNISHLRNGRRRPQPSGSTTKKLVHGIYRFACEKNRLDALCALIGASGDAFADAMPADVMPADVMPADAMPADAMPADAMPADAMSADDMPADVMPADAMPADAMSADVMSADAMPADDMQTADIPADTIRAKILAFLFSDREKQVTRKRAQTGGCRQADTFSERLSLIMSMTELSNVRLGQMLHIDASLISRYRSGVRVPRADSEVAKQICQVLYERIQKTGNASELVAMMHLPLEGFDQEGLSAWLFESEDTLVKNISSAEMLLENFEVFYEQSQSQASGHISDEAVPPEILASEENVYYDTEGLSTAVLRFLGNAVRNRVPRLMLYSDEDQSWLTEDVEFRQIWTRLMTACVKNGTQIFIIHNIDRDLNEMNAAISSWLPLYMSGMITSFYSKKDRDSRFSHTIFLAPEMACIEAFHAVGTGGRGIYHYYTSPQDLLRCTENCNVLFGQARPLLKTFPPQNMEENADITILQKVLSVATMPRELAESFQNPKFLQEWHKAHTALLNRLEGHCVRECAALADEALLRAGKVMAEQMPGTEPVFYTPEQYALHRQNMIRIAEQYPNYHFFALPDIPFSDMKLWITKKEARIIHASRPELSFLFSHPLMCRAFQDYAENLITSAARPEK